MGPHEFLTYVREHTERTPDARVVAIGGVKAAGYLALCMDRATGVYTVLSTPNQDPHDNQVDEPLSFDRSSGHVDDSQWYADLEGGSYGWTRVATGQVVVSIPGNTHAGLGPKFNDGWPDPDLSMEYHHPEMEADLDARLARYAAEAEQAISTAHLPVDTVQ
ncbi:MAG: hypothetical protein ABWY71_03195 [Candidatus Saccharimonadales bacterium]